MEGRQKKDRRFRRQRKVSNKRTNRDSILGVGLFGLLPTSILGDIGDSLPRASDRYTYIVSVPNMYHSLGREGVQSLREEVGRERAQEWEQAMQARREDEAARATQREAHNRSQYKKAKADWYSLRGTLGGVLRQ